MSNNHEVFIFYEELYFGLDDNCECVNGFLLTTKALVSRLKETVKDEFTPKTLETFHLMGFYAIYNLCSCTIDVIGSFYYFNGSVELERECEISLTGEERADLIDIMEEFCQETEHASCTGALNKYRQENGLDPLSLLPDTLA